MAENSRAANDHEGRARPSRFRQLETAFWLSSVGMLRDRFFRAERDDFAALVNARAQALGRGGVRPIAPGHAHAPYRELDPEFRSLLQRIEDDRPHLTGTGGL